MVTEKEEGTKGGTATAKDGPATAPADDQKAPATAAAGPPEKKKNKGSFKFVLGYARRECCSIIFGMFFLAGGAIADLAVPFFIG